MKKALSLLLCIALCFYLIPLPLKAAGTIQYSAITAADPEDESTFVLDNSVVSVSDAVYNPQCAGVVVYSLDAEGEPPVITDAFDGIEGKVLILSDASFEGHVPYGELYLLGNARLITEDNKMVISGSSADYNPKPALDENDLDSYEHLQNALAGAEKKHTVTGDLDIAYPFFVYDLEVEAGATLTIKGSGESTNAIIASHSLIVHGSLAAEEGQGLEIEPGCFVEGITLYDSDGNTEFTPGGGNREEFDFTGGKWVRRGDPGGGGDGPQNTYNLTLEYSPDGGSVRLDRFDGQGHMSEPPGDYPIYEGSDVNVMIEPSQGYIIQEVLLDGEPLTDEETGNPVAEYTITNFTTDHTLHIVFYQPEYEITVTYAGEGQVEAQDGLTGDEDEGAMTYTLMQGENIRFRFYPGNGHRVSEILADGQQAELRDEYEFNHVSGNHTLHVVFDEKGDGTMHAVTITASEGGTVEADGLDDGIVQVRDRFDHTFFLRPASGWHLGSVIADRGMNTEMDMTNYNVIYNGDGSFSLTLEEVTQDMTLDITFEADNAEDVSFKKYVVTADDDTAEEIAEALAREFGYVSYVVDPENITVQNINPSGIDTVGYGTFDFSVTIGGTTVEDQGYIVPTHEHIIFEFDGSYGGEPVDEIRVLTPEGIDKMEFGVPAMDSGSIRIYGAYGVRFEGVLSSDIRDAFTDGNRNEAVFDKAFYRAGWHIANAVDGFDPHGLNLFGLNMIQDNAFCVQVAASDGEDEQRTYNWDLNKYAQLTTENYTSNVFFGNDIFTLRPPESGIGAVESLIIETGEFPGYTITSDADNHYTLTFLSDFYDNIILDLLINGSAERELTIRRVGVEIQEIEKQPDSDFANAFHGTQNGTQITFTGQNNYQLFAVYYIPDFGDTAPFGLYVTYTWANGTTTTQIINVPETDGNANTGPDFDGVFRDDGNNNFASCCDYRLFAGPNKNSAPIKVNVIVLRDNPESANAFGGVYFGSGRGVEWIRED